MRRLPELAHQSADRRPVATSERAADDPAFRGCRHTQAHAQILGLQRAVGNSAVQRLLAGTDVEIVPVVPDLVPGGFAGHAAGSGKGEPAGGRTQPVVQRAPEGKGGGRRHVSATVAVKWTEDAAEFWRRLAAAAERELRLHQGAVATHLIGLGPTFHTRYQIQHHPPAGRLVRFQVSMDYDPSEYHLDVSNV
ncbi:MAG: hypothetical protein QOG89_2981 [Thermomicrobiales bacterium]|nr:hypothetical protein [Thermomicrobiales bacterium]